MLDDRHGRALGWVELGDQLEGRVGVVDVVVAEFLALQLGGGGDADARAGEGVEGRLLVRVLAVAHHLAQLAGDGLAGREVLAELPGEPGGDRRVIGRRAGIGAGRELLAQGQGRPAGLQGLQHLGQVRRIGADGDIAMVLGRRADHGRTADVDVLDALGVAAALRDSLFERIEVHIEDIDAADAVVGHGSRMFGGVAHAKQAAVDNRMQGLDPAVHHLGKLGQVRDVLDRDARRRDGRLGAAGRDQLDARLVQHLGRLDEARLVGDRQQGALGGDEIRGGRIVGGGGHGGLQVWW